MAREMVFIFVLGHSNDAFGRLSDAGLMRIEAAAATMNSLSCAEEVRIVPTGGFADHFNTTDRPNWSYAKRALDELGVPKSAVWETGLNSAHTVEDAVLIADFLSSRHASKAIVVTSQSHVARSRLILRCIAPEWNFDFVASVEPEDEAVLLHETAAIKRIMDQGGVIWGDKLFPIPGRILQ